MANILGFSGRKQGGKNTAYNYLLGTHLKDLNIVQGSVRMKPDGNLWVEDVMGDRNLCGDLVQNRNNPKVDFFYIQNLDFFIKNYSYADLLKKEVCVNILGLTYEQCFGTDEEKNSITHLKWEDMPGVITTISPAEWRGYMDGVKEYEAITNKFDFHERLDDGLDFMHHEPGFMTAREVMQFVGTQIFRKMYGNVWADATIKMIQAEDPNLAVITDVRFPNEVEAIQQAGGKVVRLTRTPFPDDNHESETALDEDRYDWNKFDLIIDNEHMTIADTHKALNDKLSEWNWWEFATEAPVTTEANE